MQAPRDRGTQRWLPLAVWLLFVLLLSFLPNHWKDALHTKGRLHDAAHLLVFGLLASLAVRAARSRDQQITAVFLCAVLGFAIEIAQDLKLNLPQGSWSPVEWNDVLVDTMAVLLIGVVQIAVLPVLRRSATRLGRSQG